VNDDEQVVRLGNERISVPEALFRPCDLGLEQGGVAEIVVESAEAAAAATSSLDADSMTILSALFANVRIVGGNVKFMNFGKRLEQELRSLIPQSIELRVLQPKDPTLGTIQGVSECTLLLCLELLLMD